MDNPPVVVGTPVVEGVQVQRPTSSITEPAAFVGGARAERNPVVLAERIQAPSVRAGTPVELGTTAPVTTNVVSAGGLPVTGANTGTLVLLGLMLMLLGALMRIAGCRRN